MNNGNSKTKELLQEITGSLEQVFTDFDIEVVENKGKTSTESLEDSLINDGPTTTEFDTEEVKEIIGETVSEYMAEAGDDGNLTGDNHELLMNKLKSKAASKKVKNLIEDSIKKGKAFEHSKEDAGELNMEMLQSLENILEFVDESELQKLSEQLLKDISAEGFEAGEGATKEELEMVAKLLDPSKGQPHKRVTEKLKKKKAMKVELKEGGEKTLADSISEEIMSMDSKENYNNYNSLEVPDGIELETPTAMFGNLKIPAGRSAYMASPVRVEADNFINSTVREIRKIKATNVEDRVNGLLVGKRIDRKSLHRKDNKIFNKVLLPEQTEAELSVYVALDFSGSTGGGLDKQIQSTGVALIEVFEKLKIKHTVMAYESGVSIIKRGVKRTNDKYVMAADGIEGQGGNNEGQVMDLVGILTSDEKEKDVVLIIITDGDGSGEEEGLRKLRNTLDKDKTLQVHSVGLNYDGGSYSLDRAQQIYGRNNAWTVMNRKDFSKTIGKIIKKSIFKKGGE